MKLPNTSTHDRTSKVSAGPYSFTIPKSGQGPAQPNFYTVPKSGAGFSIIETVIVMAIIVFIASIGVVVSLSSYQRQTFWSHLDRTTALVQQARSKAINNIAESSHGVYFDNSQDAIVLFRGSSYATRNPIDDFFLERSPSVTATPDLAEIIFAPLTGATSDQTITFTDGVRTSDVVINSEGGINW